MKNKISLYKNTIAILTLILIGVGGFFLIFVTTNLAGSGISPDSVTYIATARNILNGNGAAVLYSNDGTTPLDLVPPMNPGETMHIIATPPLYPFVLSLTGIFGFNIIDGARLLNAFLFGLNIFLFGFLIKKLTNSVVFSILASILFFISTNLIRVHYAVWSEPLFITFFIIGTLFLIEYNVYLKIKFLYFSAIFYGLAVFTRYAAAALIIIGVISILILNNEKFIKKIIRSIIFIAISCLPVGIWYLRLKLLNSGSAVRKLVFIPIKTEEIKMMFDSITRWILPGRMPLNIRIIILGIIILMFVVTYLVINYKNKNNQNQNNIKSYDQRKLKISCGFFLISIVIYFAFYLIMRYVADAQFDFYDNRHLIPIFISFFSLLIILLYIFVNAVNNRALKRISLAVVYSLFIVFIGFYSYYFIFDKGNINSFSSLRSGFGYTRYDWKTSETIEELKKFPKDILIYTNEPIAVYILADRAAYLVPAKIDVYSRKPNINYDIQVEEMKEMLKKNKGILVLFKLGLGYLPKDYELTNQLQLRLLKTCPDGAIYESY